MGGSASFLSAAQEQAVKAFVAAALPRSTREVGAFIEIEGLRKIIEKFEIVEIIAAGVSVVARKPRSGEAPPPSQEAC
jgi:hypothetical protein